MQQEGNSETNNEISTIEVRHNNEAIVEGSSRQGGISQRTFQYDGTLTTGATLPRVTKHGLILSQESQKQESVNIGQWIQTSQSDAHQISQDTREEGLRNASINDQYRQMQDRYIDS